jgi:hypothetical protein
MPSAQSFIDNPQSPWYLTVECDRVRDWIIGEVNMHLVEHFNPKTSVLEWVKIMFKSDVMVSQTTGEKFSVNFTRRIDLGDTENIFITRFILRGNEGTIILATKYWHYDKITGIWTQTEDAKNPIRKMS